MFIKPSSWWKCFTLTAVAGSMPSGRIDVEAALWCVCSEAHVDNNQHKIIFEMETQEIILKTLNL